VKKYSAFYSLPIATAKNDLRPIDTLLRLGATATDTLEFGPIRITQRKLPWPPSHAKLQSELAGVLQPNG
jgi:hypothetical protein